MVIERFREAMASMKTDDDVAGPPLPLGRRVELPGRGTTFVREVAGPPGAPTVVLVHGWLASGGLNWFQAFPKLAETFRILAPDMRGHGRGIRSDERFRFADCADDLAALMTQLDTGPAIVVGYSMGGPISTVLWRRHPHLVAALGLCATGQEFVTGNRERYAFLSLTSVGASTLRMGGLLSWLPRRIARYAVAPLPGRGRPNSLVQWSQAEMRRHDMRSVLEAGSAIATFSSRAWASEIDIPTSVLVTEHDNAVTPLAQRRLARAIPGARVRRFGDGHMACVNPRFGLAIRDLCLDLANRGNLLPASDPIDQPAPPTKDGSPAATGASSEQPQAERAAAEKSTGRNVPPKKQPAKKSTPKKGTAKAGPRKTRSTKKSTAKSAPAQK